MSDDYDIFTEVGEAGRTIVMACNHEVVSNLIRVRLQSEINWQLWVENNIEPTILAQQMRTVVVNTYGVDSVDMSGFSFNRAGRNISYGSICPTIDCDNSKACIVI